MKFGAVPLDAAEGAILAHSVRLGGTRLRKGAVLTAKDIARLRDGGHQTVTVARLEKSDLGEDQAAALLAEALAGAGVRVSAAATGRVNLFAANQGIVHVDAAAIAAFNAVNPMITVATVPQYHRVDEAAMIATVKIISYGVPSADVDRAAAAGAAALRLLSPRYRTAALIETTVGETPSSKGEDALRGRLDRLGLTLTPRMLVRHEPAAVAEALRGCAEDVIFILTASATSDIADVGPLGLTMAAGEVTQFGMPVDPGNLLFLGTLGDRPVIGLPGCARSPALNGADWVLERVICGVPPSPADFAQMGVGGLLKEIPTRPKPRAEI